MIKINDYENYILRPTPLNDSEINDVLQYERMVYQAKVYEDDITSEAVNKVKDNYEATILKATLLEPGSKGPNVDSTIERNNQMLTNLEQIKKSRSNDNMVLTRTKQEPMSFSAGFTNASIIIFFVLLVGIIASVVLLSLS